MLNLRKLNSFMCQSLRNKIFYSTQTEVGVNSATTTTENESTNLQNYQFNPLYKNRNPRNLEWSGHALKRFGWNLHYPPRAFYHRCIFKGNNNALRALLVHQSGQVVIEICTLDLEFSEHLFSLRDKSAAINLARLFADRCLQYGITHVDYFKDIGFENSEKEKIFYKTLLSNGLKLEEPPFVEHIQDTPGLDSDRTYFNTKRFTPFPPSLNRSIRKKIEEIKTQSVGKGKKVE